MICVSKVGTIKIAIVLMALLALIMPVICQDLSGKWQANVGGGFYYIRQMGNQLFWLGEQRDSNPDWCNVAQGPINGDIINLRWADVPKGGIMNGGELVLQIISSNELKIINMERGGFGADSFRRV
jgi:hypothetical protein